MFLTVAALFARIVSNPCANMLQKKIGFESSFGINFYSSLFMALLCVPFLGGIDFKSFGTEFYTLVLFAGFLCFMGTIFLIKALSFGEMSVLGPINSYKSIVGLVIAYFILGEIPSIKAFVGFLCIIFASFLFLDEKGKFILNKSVAYRLLALVFTGFEAVILKRIILLSNPFTCFVFWCLVGLLFSFVFALFFNKLKLSSKKSVKTCFCIGLLLFVMQLSTNYVFEKLDVGLSLALFQLSSIVSLVIGFRVFDEKGILKKTIGTLIMIFGSILILLK